MANLRSFFSKNDNDTWRLGKELSKLMCPGDTVLLYGDIGAGKSLLCRSLILELLEYPEDIPSPTFTLVQTYHAPVGEIWHCDLYRLGHEYDLIELGLIETFQSAITLVEWAERLASLTPDDALAISFQIFSEVEREIQLSWSDEKWTERLETLFL